VNLCQEPTSCSALQEPMAVKLKDWARAIKRDVHAVYLAARDPRVPWYAKVLALCVAAAGPCHAAMARAKLPYLTVRHSRAVGRSPRTGRVEMWQGKQSKIPASEKHHYRKLTVSRAEFSSAHAPRTARPGPGSKAGVV
jgi:hypothetical protein